MFSLSHSRLPNKPERANRRQAVGFREAVGDAVVMGLTAAVAHPGRWEQAHSTLRCT